MLGPDVLVELPDAGVLHPTDAADDIFYLVVSSLDVSLKGSVGGVSLVAEVTLESFDVLVDRLDVQLQSRLSAELFLADVAAKLSIPVHGRDVLREVPFVGDQNAANVAFEGWFFFLRVNSFDVILKIRSVVQFLVAASAFVAPDGGVNF